MGLFDSFKKIRGKVSASKVSSSRGSKRVVGLMVLAYEEGIIFKNLRYFYCVFRDNDPNDVVYDSFEDSGNSEYFESNEPLNSPRECIDHFWTCFYGGLCDVLGVNDPDDAIDLRVSVFDVNGELVGKYEY